MSDSEYEAEAHSLNLNDILFILFRHKWKIFLCATAGILAAAAVHFLLPPLYEVNAELLVRYVVERSAVDPFDSSVKTPGSEGVNLINSEVEILTSRDLITQVAETVGVERLLRGSKGNAKKADAVRSILSNLHVTAGKDTNIISISYKNTDPELSVLVLKELVSQYFSKHLEVHRSQTGAFDFVRRETDQVRTRLNQTEKDLRQLHNRAGINSLASLAESTTTLNTELRNGEQELGAAEAEFASQQARVAELDRLKSEDLMRAAGQLNLNDPLIATRLPVYQTAQAEKARLLNAGLGPNHPEVRALQAQIDTIAGQLQQLTQIEKGLAWAQTDRSDKNSTLQVSTGTIQEYQALTGRVANLRQKETELLSKWTPDNPSVKFTRAQLEGVEKQRRDLEAKYPGLLETVPSAASSQSARRDLVSEKAQLVAIKARTEALRSRVSGIRERLKTLSESGPQLAELERKKELEEANYKYFEASLERARIDETLDPSRMPNISVVQQPVAAEKYAKDKTRIVFGLAVGGLAIGIAIALLIELVMDRTVKRQLELEARLRIPLLLSIPYFGRNGHLRVRLPYAVPEPMKALQQSASPNVAPWESDHFIRPFCEAIRDRLILYFGLHRITHEPKLVAFIGVSIGAGASTLAAGLAAALSETCDGKVLLVDQEFDTKRFFELIAEFKRSDFDYVIFDLPSLSDTGTTLAMAAFMDKVLLVVEAEASNRDVVKRAYAELAAAKASVSVVFNKSRSYGPKWLQVES
ncbi:MAG: Wzz/FepE/Etk N-terminal domain-containing protein [Chthoniobacterales bacterium]